jgi:hypothetical protein
MGFRPGFRCPALKRVTKVETFSGALKHSFPRIDAGAPTKKYTPWVLHRLLRTRERRAPRFAGLFRSFCNRPENWID